MLAQLESKILDLQTQIQSTQEQITDYETNPKYKQTIIYCRWCVKYVTTSIYSHNSACPCRSGRADWIRDYTTTTTKNTKATELAQAQAQLATLQNELKTTQNQYIQMQTRAMILYQAFLLTIPPSKIQASQKVLKSIESLQDYLRQEPLFTTAQARQVVD